MRAIPIIALGLSLASGTRMVAIDKASESVASPVLPPGR